MSLFLAVQYAVPLPECGAYLPSRSQLRRWVSLALAQDASAQLTVRLVGQREGRLLNHDFRGRDYASNVLSFPLDPPPGLAAIAAHAPLRTRQAKPATSQARQHAHPLDKIVRPAPRSASRPRPQPIWGDLVLCAPVIAREAAEQQKPARMHWAHLVIHGLLHLQGHDHQDAAAAAQMEALEIALLNHLRIPDPYTPVPAHAAQR